MRSHVGRVVGLPLLLAACATTQMAPPAPAAPTQVTGTVTYVQRIALPPSATVRVQLIDVSRADAPATVIGEQVIAAAGRQPPFAFGIAYDPAKIDPRHTYAVAARIEDGGKLLFINDRRHEVITRGAPTTADLVLRHVAAPR